MAGWRRPFFAVASLSLFVLFSGPRCLSSASLSSLSLNVIRGPKVRTGLKTEGVQHISDRQFVCPPRRPQEDRHHSTSGSSRRWMVAGAALLGALSFSTLARAADPEVDLYFGTGTFYRLQHELVMKEALELGRREGDITALAGYAGGKKAGPLERLCYNGLLGAPDHVSLGHAQVVRITLPTGKISDFTKTYLDQIKERKLAQQGSQFRAVIGIRGGMSSQYYPQIQEACEGRVKLAKGEGNEPDTFGTDTVYVYDSRRFPWRPAETSNQFRDDPPTYYDRDYKEIYEKQKKLGIILRTGCPGE